VYVQRKGHNKYEISYENESVIVDLNLPKTESYKIPYQIPKVDIKSKDLGEFSIIHSGSGDGWNPNLPCFGSVVYFREKFYLVDAGPNIEQILIQLGLTFDDIEGIFQTHGHDDHFAGLPSFFHKKKKTKFFATSIVKDSVIKKLDALLSVQKEKSFSECFDFHPLEFDQWNIVEDGLEVKPLLSPHPVETSIFVFQAKNQDGENKNYGHFADIVSFNVLQNMVTDDPEQLGVSQEFFDQVKSEYLEPLSLKKVDIGGGMIHGEAVDFIGDQSDKLILAHTSGDLTPEQAKVGGTASFGSYDVLIQKLAE
ncbi:MAG: hemerythrin, partial [bacterium]